MESLVEQSIDRDRRGRFVKEHHVARAGGVPLALVRKRRAPLDGTHAPVLLVHGFGQNRYAWHLPSRSLANHLAQAGYDVWNLDVRGHGRSRELGAPAPRSVGELVREDLPAAVDAVHRASGGRRVFVLGHSLGGLVAYAAASGLHGALAGIAGIGSPYHFTRGSRTLGALGRLLRGVDRGRHLGHGAVPLGAWGGLVRAAPGFVESRLFPFPLRGFCPGKMEPEVLAEHMRLAMDRASVALLRDLYDSAENHGRASGGTGGLVGYAEAFERLDLPLLVVAGTHDDLAPPASVEPGYARSRSSRKRYALFPQGHTDLLVGRDAPHTVWPEIERFLREASRA